MEWIINPPLFVLQEHRPIAVLDDLNHLLDKNLVASEAHYERMGLQQKWIVLTRIWLVAYQNSKLVLLLQLFYVAGLKIEKRHLYLIRRTDKYIKSLLERRDDTKQVHSLSYWCVEKISIPCRNWKMPPVPTFVRGWTSTGTYSPVSFSSWTSTWNSNLRVNSDHLRNRK